MEVRNRFKGLDLRDRVSDELWAEVPDIVQETRIKTIPMEKKHRKAKYLERSAPFHRWEVKAQRGEVRCPGLHSNLNHD